MKLTENKDNLLVAVALSLNLPKDIDSVIVSEGAGHLVIVHGQVVLLYAPEAGQTRGVNNLENTGLLEIKKKYRTIEINQEKL